MIVRLMGEGQWQVDDTLVAHLNELDLATAHAVEAGSTEDLQHALEALHAAVRDGGTQLPDDYLGASDCIIPPDDLSLEEAKELLQGEGLVPDLPT